MRRKYIILIIVLSIGGILFFQNMYIERKDKEISLLADKIEISLLADKIEISLLADKIEKQKIEFEKHLIDYFPKEMSDSSPIKASTTKSHISIIQIQERQDIQNT